MIEVENVVECGLCGKPTTMHATRRCDYCWALETRIQANPELARKILADMQPGGLREELEAAAKSMDSAIRILNDTGTDHRERVLEARAYLHSRASVAWQALHHTNS